MVLILILLMGIMFILCMDFGESGFQQWVGVVKVNDRMGYVIFIDVVGMELIFINMIFVILNVRMVYIYCQVDEGQDFLINFKLIKIIFLVDFIGIDVIVIIILKVGELGDVIINVFVGLLSFVLGYLIVVLFQFSENMIVLLVFYCVKNVIIIEDIKNEFVKYIFIFVCYIDDIKFGDIILKFYLCYKVEDEFVVIVECVICIFSFKVYEIS